MDAHHISLFIGWILWCSLHSLLISVFASSRLQDMMGRYRSYYRLFYNILALVTLVPLMVTTAMLSGDVVFRWGGWYHLLQVLLLGLSFMLFSAGGARYNLRHFLGLWQIQHKQQHSLLSDDPHFSTDGVFGMTRHPWYLGSLLFLWSVLPAYNQTTIMVALILSFYLVIGAYLEEQKIVAEFGEGYRHYQQQVSMFFPLKWLRRKLKRQS